ncbi:hypothetical protein PsorP6_001427 [Peronosclerospora sorghi]|uniref:Uncharacterized protein n=1 Tax=Peronosclerospora sorghi TaxID=230839 RepID=A0ACC0WSA3_9STRA|nr:hypothetical protein PsorP6_001427 [Peronosclerospora sorghi]
MGTRGFISCPGSVSSNPSRAQFFRRSYIAHALSTAHPSGKGGAWRSKEGSTLCTVLKKDLERVNPFARVRCTWPAAASSFQTYTSDGAVAIGTGTVQPGYRDHMDDPSMFTQRTRKKGHGKP